MSQSWINSDEVKFVLKKIRSSNKNEWTRLTTHPVCEKLAPLASEHLRTGQQWDTADAETKFDCIYKLCKKTIDSLNPATRTETDADNLDFQTWYFLQHFYIGHEKDDIVRNPIGVGNSASTYWEVIRPQARRLVANIWNEKLEAKHAVITPKPAEHTGIYEEKPAISLKNPELLSAGVLIVRTSPVISLPNFTGREAHIYQLDQWYKSSIPLACILGLTGIGKSWLAIRWLTDKKEMTPGFNWLRVDAREVCIGDTPEQFTDHVLDHIRSFFSEDSQMHDVSPGQLATWVRRTEIVLLIDQAECMLDPVGGTGKEVGRLTDKLREFLTDFVTITEGRGRIIITSNLQPSGLVEQFRIEAGQIALISGGGKDPIHLGGLSETEATQLISARLEQSHGYSDDVLKVVARRFEGHPFAIRLFTDLTAEEREVVIQDTSPRKPMIVELNNLLSKVARYCTPEEMSLLKAVTILKKPETPDVLSEVFRYDFQITANALENLHRRSLAEYCVSSGIGAGYSAHGVVYQWVSQAYANELTQLHNRLALIYSSRDEALPAAYHFHQADNASEARKWRNIYTQRNIQAGREFHCNGDYSMARDCCTEFIKESETLPQTAMTPIFLSRAYFNRAVSQHREKFDWDLEIQDLRKALDFWPDNEWAITFYVTILSEALRIRKPWAEIENELQQVVPIAEKLYRKTNRDSPAQSALLRLLCFWGYHTANHAQQKSVFEKLSDLVAGVQVGMGLLKEETYKAFLQALGFLTRHSSSPDRASTYANLATELADDAAEFDKSGDLILLRAQAYHLKGDLETDIEERRELLGSAYEILYEIKRSSSIPYGFASELTGVTMSLTGHDGETGVSTVEIVRKSIDLIGELRARSERYTDLDAAEMRLLHRASELEPEQRVPRMNQALKIARKIFQRSYRLTPGFAEAAIKVFIESSTIESDSKTADDSSVESQSSQLTQQINIARNEIRDLDKILEEADKELPSRLYLVLRLKLRAQYLVTHWTANDPIEPNIVANTIPLASNVVSELKDEPDALQVVSDFWDIVARRTCREERYNQAKQGALEAYGFLFSLPRWPRKASMNYARFLRNILDYDSSRIELKKYLSQEKSPYARYLAVSLFLDVVAHSLHWSKSATAVLDADARQAVELYDEYLSFIGKEIEGEDVSDRRVARRVLHWLRCKAYITPASEASLTWFRMATEGLKIEASSIKNPDVLARLTRDPDPIARIIGWHWNDPSSWREVGTWISAVLGAEPRNKARAVKFWKIAQIIMAMTAREKGRSKQEDVITELNIARFLLTSARGSPEWQTGADTAKRYAESNRIPWIYRLCAQQLLKEAHEA